MTTPAQVEDLRQRLKARAVEQLRREYGGELGCWLAALGFPGLAYKVKRWRGLS